MQPLTGRWYWIPMYEAKKNRSIISQSKPIRFYIQTCLSWHATVSDCSLWLCYGFCLCCSKTSLICVMSNKPVCTVYCSRRSARWIIDEAVIRTPTLPAVCHRIVSSRRSSQENQQAAILWLHSHQSCLVHFNLTLFCLSSKASLLGTCESIDLPQNLGLDLVEVNYGAVRMHCVNVKRIGDRSKSRKQTKTWDILG